MPLETGYPRVRPGQRWSRRRWLALPPKPPVPEHVAGAPRRRRKAYRPKNPRRYAALPVPGAAERTSVVTTPRTAACSARQLAARAAARPPLRRRRRGLRWPTRRRDQNAGLRLHPVRQHPGPVAALGQIDDLYGCTNGPIRLHERRHARAGRSLHRAFTNCRQSGGGSTAGSRCPRRDTLRIRRSCS